jgi:hypothetical protein
MLFSCGVTNFFDWAVRLLRTRLSAELTEVSDCSDRMLGLVAVSDCSDRMPRMLGLGDRHFSWVSFERTGTIDVFDCFDTVDKNEVLPENKPETDRESMDWLYTG